VKIAYLIITHSNADQLARLVGTLPQSSPVFIHVDARASADVYNDMRRRLSARPATEFVRRYACRWGDIGIVRATMELIKSASNTEFDFATLLSGSDYPIKSNKEIARVLEISGRVEHIEAMNTKKHAEVDKQVGLYKADFKLRRFHIRFRSRVLPTWWIRQIPNGLVAFSGSQWWTLTKDAICYIDQYNRKYPNLMRFAVNSFIPDESVIQTIIGNSPFSQSITQNNLRCVIWDRPAPPYPAVLQIEDLGFLIASKSFFARKFDPNFDSSILDALDKVIE